MRKLHIRQAQSADVEAISTLLEQLGYPQEDLAATAARIRAWTDSPAAAVYVAAVEDRILGVIAVLVCPFFEHDGNWGRIVALVVSDQVRNQGVGSRLLTVAEAFAWKNDCLRVELTTSDHRKPLYAAHGFYRRCGYFAQTGTSTLFRKSRPVLDDDRL